jgi:hypothetical protein
MFLANQQRPPTGETPGMAVVPNTGKKGVQWFNFQGSGFSGSIPPNNFDAEICWAPPGGSSRCERHRIDRYGVVGLSIQISDAVPEPTGIWTAWMRDIESGNTTPIVTFTVEP